MQRWRLAPQSILFAVFLGALAALPPISIDMALPALVDIARSLHASASQAGLTLILFMAGFSVGPVLVGPLPPAPRPTPPALAGPPFFPVGGVVVCASARAAVGLARDIGAC